MTKRERRTRALERRKRDVQRWREEGNERKERIAMNDVKALRKKLGVQ